MSEETPTTTEATTTPDWREQIPADLRQEKVWESVPDLATLAKNYVDMSKYTVGALRMPGENATAEEIEKFYAKLGRPGTPDEYKVPEAPEGVGFDEARLAALKKTAHQHGLSAKQFDALAQTFFEQDAAQVAAMRHTANAVIDDLKNTWGGAYERKLSIAQRTMTQVFGEEVAQQIAGSQLGNNKTLIQNLAKLGEQLMEDGLMSASTGDTMSKDSAKAELDKLVASPAYLNARHPEHKATAERVTRLFEFMYN